MSLLKAVREKCKDCMCGQINEIKLCPIEDCALYPSRFGKNPFIPKRDYSEEQREAMRERMKQMHLAKKHDSLVMDGDSAQ